METNQSTNNGSYNITIQGIRNESNGDINLTIHQTITSFDKQGFLAELQHLLHPQKPIFLMVLTSTATQIREKLAQESTLDFTFEEIAIHYTDKITEWKPYEEDGTILEILHGFEQTYNCKLCTYFVDCQEDMPTQNFLDEIKLQKQNLIWVIDNFSLLSEGNRKIIQQFDHIYIGGCLVPKADSQNNKRIAKFVKNLQQKSFPSLWNYTAYSDSVFNGKIVNHLKNIELEINDAKKFKKHLALLIEDCLQIKLQAAQIGAYQGKKEIKI